MDIFKSLARERGQEIDYKNNKSKSSLGCDTRVMAEYEIWEPLQCKNVFNTYLSLGRSNQKVEEIGLAFIWPNCYSRDLPNPNT